MIDWPHAPVHRLDRAGTYFVTAGTYLKQHFYRRAGALDTLQSELFRLSKKHCCSLQAWALLSNHYHLVCVCDGPALRAMLQELHSTQAKAINKRDGTSGRKVWFQFRDTLLTYERSWLARLRYTHTNAVHHRLVGCAEEYRWCSAQWFAGVASPALVNTVSRFKVDRVNVGDAFEVVMPEP